MILNPLAAGRRLAWLRRDVHGAAIVEFAIVVPVFFLVVFAVIDFGRALWTMNVLTAGVREGARTAAAYVQTSQANTPNIAAAQTIVKDRVRTYVNGALGGGGGTITDDNICAHYDAATGLVTVTLVTTAVTAGTACPAAGNTTGFVYSPITPFAGQMGLLNLRFQPRAVFRWELAS